MSIGSTIRKLFGGDAESRALRDYGAKLKELEESQKRAQTEVEQYRVQLEGLARKIERKRQEYETALGAQKELAKLELASLFNEQKKSESKRDAIFHKIEQNATLIANLETLIVQGGGTSVNEIDAILDEVEDRQSRGREVDRAMSALEKNAYSASSFESIDVDAELAKLAQQTANVHAAKEDELKTSLPSVDEVEANLAQTRALDEPRTLCE